MPIHDWRKASPGYFHHFHQQWSGAICAALNARRLPKRTIALLERTPDAIVPNVLELKTSPSHEHDLSGRRGGVAVATEPPKTRFISRAAEDAVYAAKANRVVLHRHDETIAVIEIVSPGNKSSVIAVDQFAKKSRELLERGIHLLVVDLFPPTSRDPQGIHEAIWAPLNDEPFELPADKQLTLASYAAYFGKTAYVEPVAVGDVLPEMPVFLDDKTYVRVPLEETYEATWKLCPEEFRERIVHGEGSKT